MSDPGLATPAMPPRIIAHRGGAGLWPENTMAAFDAALALGAHGLEIDIHLTRDGHVVVHHDAALRPDTARDAAGEPISEAIPIDALTLEDLRSYDVGELTADSPYARLYPQRRHVPGERVPTLGQVLDRIAATPSGRLLVELKSTFYVPDAAFDPEPLVAAASREIAARGCADRCVLMSFDWRFLNVARDLAPDIRRGYTTVPGRWLRHDPPPEHAQLPAGFAEAVARQVAAGPDWMLGFAAQDWADGAFLDFIGRDTRAAWIPNHYDVTAPLVARARALGLETWCWTADREEDLRRVRAAGVTGIITDYPDRGLALLAD